MKPRHALQEFAIELRNNATDVEQLLWRQLRNRQVEGAKFRRQQPIESYIVDFVCFNKKVIIELDGGQHSENRDYDMQRDICLRSNGYTVLRFWNNDVIENVEGILEVIRQHCLSDFPLPPTPARQGRGSKRPNSSPSP